jgi:hypothetical protein
MPIASRSSSEQARTVAGVDTAFSEIVRLSFLKNGTVDPSRSAVDVHAVLRVGGGKETNVAGGSASSWRTKLAAGKAELHIDRRTYPDLPVRTGDAIRAMSRLGKPWFDVLRVDDRGDGRLVLELGEK